MKKGTIVLTVVLLLTSTKLAFSQRTKTEDSEEKKTLLSKRPLTGGFVGVGFKGGELNNQEDIWIGGEVGTVFDHDLALGLAGYGLINSVKSTNALETEPLYYQAGYGGLFIEPYFFENKVVNLSIPVILGAGGIAETRRSGIVDELDSFEFTDSDFYNSDVFWVVEPGLALQLNVSRWMKISGGASYRFVYDLEMTGSGSTLLNGINGTVSLKLGWF